MNRLSKSAHDELSSVHYSTPLRWITSWIPKSLKREQRFRNFVIAQKCHASAKRSSRIAWKLLQDFGNCILICNFLDWVDRKLQIPVLAVCLRVRCALSTKRLTAFRCFVQKKSRLNTISTDSNPISIFARSLSLTTSWWSDTVEQSTRQIPADERA
jgi:hypothetical protein